MRRPGTLLLALVVVGALLRTVGLADAPPGLFFDEAANGVDALDVLAGHHPIFFVGNQGREPLHIYATALATALVGPGWLAIRLPNVLVGTATIPALYLLGREVGGTRVGLFSALLIAASYWHVSLSRLGFRAVWTPLVVALTLALLLRALRTRRLWPAVLCGLAIGLGQYTYTAARLVPPLALAVAASGPLLTQRWRRWPMLLAPFVVAAVVAAPLGLYFARNPDQFWGRAENLSGWGMGSAERVWDAVGIFVWRGDDIPRHNLPFRPLFDPIAGGLFLLGLVLCLSRWRRPAFLALPVACLVMLLPQALATGHPHFLRAAGILPPAIVIAAVGMAAALARLRPVPRRALSSALAVFWLALTPYLYFAVWAPSREVYVAFEAQGRDAGRLIRTLPSGQPVSAGSWTYDDRPTFFLDVARPGFIPFDEARAIVVPGPGSAVVLPSLRDLPARIRARLGTPALTTGRWRDDAGQPAVALYQLGPEAIAPRERLGVAVGSLATIDGYDLERVVSPGSTEHVELVWRPTGSSPAPIQQFAHAVRPEPGGRERVWADHDVEAYPSHLWRGGETVLTWFNLTLPDDAPTGAYWVATGFYDRATLGRLPLADPSGKPAGDRLLLGPFKVWDPGLAVPRPAAPLARLEGVTLASARLPERVASGAELPLELTWWASGPTARPLTVFLHLLDESNKERGGADGPPAGGLNPTDLWQAGERIVDPRALRLPPDLPPGRYAVEVGLYDAVGGQRLRLIEAAERLGDGAIVGRVTIGS